MTKRARIAVGLAAVATAVVLAPTARERAGEPVRYRTEPEIAQPGADPAGEPLAAAAGPWPTPGTEPPNPRANRDLRLLARRIADRFIRSFLDYQRGALTGQVRQTLEATATRSLARRLLARPPRAVDRGAAGRLVRVAIYGPFRGRMKAAALVAYGSGQRSLLELALVSRDGPPRVAQVEP